MPDELHSALHRYFGYSEFRPLQERIIRSLMAGRDAFVLMPTGGGKSLCYQLPAAMMDGVTLVVSPLIALMKDQVDQLNAAGIPATFLNSSLDPQEADARISGLLRGAYKLLYVAPERLVTSSFLALLDRLPLKLFAIDEAHCISEWGHDFRAEYRQLSLLKRRWPKVPLIAMTATATARVQEDILNHLDLLKAEKFRASFNRPNLIYSVRPKAEQFQDLLGFLSKHKSESGIIYCLSRDGTERLALALQQQGFKALPYHAGLDQQARSKNQEQFSRDKVDIVCATIAFGMGINKSNVRFVVHYDLPKHLAGYYQETGRAGRDGLPADCLLFFSLADRTKLLRFVDEMSNETERTHAKYELDKIVAFAQTDTCRRVALLDYFDEEYTEVPCGSCDNCLHPAEDRRFEATRETQMFLSCLVRLRESFGAGHVIEVLRGADNDRVLSWRHHELPTFGIGKDISRSEWKWIASELVRCGYLRQDHANHSVLKLTLKGRDALKKDAHVELQRPPAGMRIRGRKGEPVAEAATLPYDNEELFQRLRSLRRRIAERENVAPFIIFHDTALKQIAARVPVTLPELLEVPGVSENKARKYGEEILQTVANYADEVPRLSKIEIDLPTLPQIPAPVSGAYETKSLLDNGYSIPETAARRKLSPGTVVTHATQLIAHGDEALFGKLISPERHQILRQAFEKLGWLELRPVLDHLIAENPDAPTFSYDELNFTRAFEVWKQREAVKQ